MISIHATFCNRSWPQLGISYFLRVLHWEKLLVPMFVLLNFHCSHCLILSCYVCIKIKICIIMKKFLSKKSAEALLALAPYQSQWILWEGIQSNLGSLFVYMLFPKVISNTGNCRLVYCIQNSVWWSCWSRYSIFSLCCWICWCRCPFFLDLNTMPVKKKFIRKLYDFIVNHTAEFDLNN